MGAPANSASKDPMKSPCWVLVNIQDTKPFRPSTFGYGISSVQKKKHSSANMNIPSSKLHGRPTTNVMVVVLRENMLPFHVYASGSLRFILVQSYIASYQPFTNHTHQPFNLLSHFRIFHLTIQMFSLRSKGDPVPFGVGADVCGWSIYRFRCVYIYIYIYIHIYI